MHMQLQSLQSLQRLVVELPGCFLLMWPRDESWLKGPFRANGLRKASG